MLFIIITTIVIGIVIIIFAVIITINVISIINFIVTSVPDSSPQCTCRLQNWPSVEVLPAALHRQRHLHKPSLRRANSAELPPLRALPPPITLHSQPAVDVDLDVDYQSEVAPFLGQCLVSFVCEWTMDHSKIRP